MDTADDQGVELGVVSTLELIPVEPLLGMVTVFVRGTTDTLATAFLVALVAIFLLAEAPRFPAKLRLALGDRGASFMWLEGVMAEIQRYLALKTLISAVGMFLSVPLTMVGKIVLEHTDDYRWIAAMMTGRQKPPLPLEDEHRPRGTLRSAE